MRTGTRVAYRKLSGDFLGRCAEVAGDGNQQSLVRNNAQRKQDFRNSAVLDGLTSVLDGQAPLSCADETGAAGVRYSHSAGCILQTPARMRP